MKFISGKYLFKVNISPVLFLMRNSHDYYIDHFNTMNINSLSIYWYNLVSFSSFGNVGKRRSSNCRNIG